MLIPRVLENHLMDEQGRPSGGSTTSVGIKIDWQCGPLGTGEDRKEPNGAFVENVLIAAVGRLQFYQKSKFACRQNALAITKIEEAIHWLQDRTSEREMRGVEGTLEL